MKKIFRRRTIVPAAAAALAMASGSADGVAFAQDKNKEGLAGRYATGDFHNHTTCSDGTLSLQKLVDKSTRTYGLDWFVQAGHGGNSRRNCTLREDPFEPVAPALGLTAPPTIPAGGQPAETRRGPNQTWVDTLPGGAAAIKGDVVLQSGVRSMWRWQMIQEFVYPVIEQESRNRSKPIFVGLEQNAPGHEHVSTVVATAQLPKKGKGDATDMAQYEYCFDRSDNDRSRGANNRWDCAVPESAANALLDPAARKIIVPSGPNSGIAGHEKTVEGIKWMAAFHPDTSYFVPAHVERAGAFNPNGSNGFNIEHLRDFHNAAPEIAFGFESYPGHQADEDRGGYGRGAAGGGTYGGCGVYAGALGGVWDALLGEGRGWWFFASSDFHSRGSFGPDQLETNGDFYPGEYTRDYTLVRAKKNQKYGPEEVVDGLRSGNSYVTNGDLIDRMSFAVCVAKDKPARRNPLEKQIAKAAANGEAFSHPDCASMGETLKVNAGEDVWVTVVLRDPEGKNNAPYGFPNPSLRQIGLTQPLNQPVLDHVDLIGGNVTGKVDPSDTARYAGVIGTPAASNPSTAIKAVWNFRNWESLEGGWRRMSYRVTAPSQSQYVRLRGTNIPAATPFETDSRGNPILDFDSEDKIPCADAACPAHLRTDAAGVKMSSSDVEAWADLWFYSNPIFLKIK